MSDSVEGQANLLAETLVESPQVSSEKFSLNRVLSSIIIFSLAGVLLYAAATLMSDYERILRAIKLFPIRDLGIVMGLVTVGWLIRGWRFHYYLVNMGEKAPLTYTISAFLAGFSLTGTPGKVGEAMKGVFLKRDYSVSITRVVGVVVVERLMDLFAVLILGAFSLVFFEGWTTYFLALAAVVITTGTFLCMEKLYRPILEAMARLPVISWFATKALGILLSGKDLMRPRIFLIGLLVSIVAWSMESVSMFIIMKGFQLPASLTEANFVYCFSTILGALSMLPGGIGGTEAGMIAIFAYLGISYTSGLPAVILIRLCTLWYAIFVGMVFSLYLLAVPKNQVSNDCTS